MKTSKPGLGENVKKEISKDKNTIILKKIKTKATKMFPG